MTAHRVEMRDATREFRDGGGIRGVTLTVSAGEIVALVGLNGAGKTTLMRVLLGMLIPSEGSVEFDGVRLHRIPAAQWAAVGHLVDHPLIYRELTARQNLELSARLYWAPATAVARSLTEFDLSRYAQKRARALSMGNRQRVGLASALQHDPSLIVLDEPTNSLDPAGVILLRDALRRRADAGAAVLVSSHHLDEVARVAHRIVVLNDGRLVGGLDPDAAELERAFFEMVRLDDERRRP
ncbi:ABC transporter ATP-binding protein [Gordonia sp. LSe1-13]|uniref:ABC transporter ATP-binding protein n=1 Tax=Gordonia sesuvii TaxID=3116777 RepID=A0ABU7M8A2_9ACTN|nr:ABC transporter ATP-binding protein [Gordonia sp. LSe1-13]